MLDGFGAFGQDQSGTRSGDRVWHCLVKRELGEADKFVLQPVRANEIEPPPRFRIAQMTELRTRIDGSIPCGRLSLNSGALYNPVDRAAQRGAGPRYLLGDPPTED